MFEESMAIFEEFKTTYEEEYQKTIARHSLVDEPIQRVAFAEAMRETLAKSPFTDTMLGSLVSIHLSFELMNNRIKAALPHIFNK